MYNRGKNPAQVRMAVIVGLVGAISFSPEIALGFFVPGGYPITIRIEDLVVAAVLLAWISIGIREVFVPRFLYFAGLYLTFALVVTQASILVYELSPIRSLFFWAKEFEFAIIAVIVANTVRTRHELKVFAISVVAGSLLNAIWAHYQVATGRYGPLLPTQEANAYGTALIGQPSPLASAAFYLPGLFIALAFILKSDKWRVGYIVLSLALFGAVVGAVSRSTLVASVISMTIVLLAYSETDFRPPAAAIALVVALTYPVASSQDILLFRRFRFENLQQGIVGRGQQWISLLSESLPNSVLGYGKGSLGYLLGFREAHNYYLRVFIETGIIGLGLFLLVVYAVYDTATRMISASDDSWVQSIGIAAIGVTVSMLIIAMFQDVFITVKAAEGYWLLLGGLGSVYCQNETGRTTSLK